MTNQNTWSVTPSKHIAIDVIEYSSVFLNAFNRDITKIIRQTLKLKTSTVYTDWESSISANQLNMQTVNTCKFGTGTYVFLFKRKGKWKYFWPVKM